MKRGKGRCRDASARRCDGPSAGCDMAYVSYNLTDKQQQLVRDLVRLCNTAQHKSFNYTPTFNNRDNVEAHGTSIKASASDRDLKTLEAEGFITLKWLRH